MRHSAFLAAIAILAACAYADDWQDLRGTGHAFSMHDKRIGGLGFQVRLDGWPELRKAAVPYYSTGEGGGFGKLPPDLSFGKVRTSGPLSQKGIVRKDWTHAVLSPAENLQLTVSRLSPALLVQCTARQVLFFAGGKGPAPALVATASGVIPVDRLRKVNLARDAWLLVWFDKDAGFGSTRFPYVYDGRHWVPGPSAAVDCPILFVFADAKPQVTVSKEGLAVQYGAPSSEANRIAVLPLLGDVYPPVTETGAWSKKLPDRIARQCAWWAEHLSEVPMTADETYAYDPDKDTITITTEVGFTRLREGGTRFAPVSPMLALAAQHGFPVEFTGKVVKSGLLTSVGPYVGLEGVASYRCTVSGLGKYVLQRRRIAPVAKEPPELAKRLAEEVRKIVSAGHLAPWYPTVNVYGAGYRTYLTLGGTLEWSNPGQTLYILSQALPLLPDQLRAETIEYMIKERTQFPPEKIAVLPVEKGARRERARIDRGEVKEVLLEHNDLVKQRNFYAVNGLIPEESLYYLQTYVGAVGHEQAAADWGKLKPILYPYLRSQEWATLGWWRWPGALNMWLGMGGVVDADNHFAALVGALCLARADGDRVGEQYLWGQFARTAALRFAMARYADYLCDSRMVLLPTDADIPEPDYLAYCAQNAQRRKIAGLRGRPDWMARFFEGSWTGRLVSYHWTGAADDLRSVVRLNEFGVYFDEVADQYHGRGDLLAYRGMTPELGRFLRDFDKARARTFVDRVEEHMPEWYTAMCLANIGAEHNYLHPDNAYQCFLARAWVLGEGPAKLRRYLDVPWMARGDLYYVHKLVETINAYRGVKWERR